MERKILLNRENVFKRATLNFPLKTKMPCAPRSMRQPLCRRTSWACKLHGSGNFPPQAQGWSPSPGLQLVGWTMTFWPKWAHQITRPVNQELTLRTDEEPWSSGGCQLPHGQEKQMTESACAGNRGVVHAGNRVICAHGPAPLLLWYQASPHILIIKAPFFYARTSGLLLLTTNAPTCCDLYTFW